MSMHPFDEWWESCDGAPDKAMDPGRLVDAWNAALDAVSASFCPTGFPISETYKIHVKHLHYPPAPPTLREVAKSLLEDQYKEYGAISHPELTVVRAENMARLREALEREMADE